MTRTFRARCMVGLLVLGLAGPLGAQQQRMRVVATNTWTAAIAAAAGATDVVTIAPAGLRHPAEYELKPSDVAALKAADLVVFTGFEVMARKLADAADSQRIRLLQIRADYSLAGMRGAIMAIADVLGTQATARANVASLEGFIASWKAELGAEGLLGAPIVAHVFQQPLVLELGFTVKAVFGPAPLEAAQIAVLSSSKADFIVDNWHNEVAGPLRETMKASRYVSFINFSGPDGTVTLLDVLKANRARLKAAAVK